MENTKKIIIAALAAVVIIAAIAGIFFGKNKKITLTEKTLTSFTNPMLSQSEDLLAYFKNNLKEDNESEHPAILTAQLNTINFKNRSVNQYFTIEIPQKNDVKILSVNENNILYEIIDYNEYKAKKYSFSIKEGISSLISETSGEGNERIVNPLNPKQTAATLNDPQKGYSSITLSSGNGSDITISEKFTGSEYFYNLQWLGNNIIFQAHTQTGIQACDELWLYNTESSQLSKLENNCSNLIISKNSSTIAVLIPSKVKEKNIWDMSVKQISDKGETTLIANDCFKEETFLYDWSPSGKGFLIQKGNGMYFYDIHSQHSKSIQNAEKDGWWGYPSSPYYTSFNKDGTKLAILNYKEMESGKYLESLTVFDLQSETKDKIYEHEIDSFGKKIPFKNEFYPHIIWNSKNNCIIFEAKKPNNPTLKRLISVSNDGKKKRVIVGGMFN